MVIKINDCISIYNKKSKIYHCKIIFQIDNDLMSFDYTSENEEMHNLFCKMKDDYNVNNATTIFFMVCVFFRVAIKVFDKKRGDK